VAVVSLTVVISVPVYVTAPFEQTIPDWLIAWGVAAGVVLSMAAWVERNERPTVSFGLTVATIALFVPIWAGWSWMPNIVQAWALAVAPLGVAGAMQVGTRWSRERPESPELWIVWGLTIGATIVHALGYDPLADPGCVRTCAPVDALAAVAVSTPVVLNVVTVLVAGAGLVAAIGLTRTFWAGRSRGIVLASLAAVVLLVWPWIARAIAPTIPPSTIDQLLPLALAGLILGSAPLVATLRMRRIRAEMQQLVGQLSDVDSAREEPAGAWRRIDFAVPGEDRWVDAAGEAVGLVSEPQHSLVVSDAAGPVLRLSVADGDDPGDVLAALTPATMLALRNARLAAVSRARLTELQASQRRIVAAADAERERIERDLHDGAQQHLVGAAFQLSLARNRLPADDDALVVADAAVREALARLRALGHGIFPTVLTSDGLAAALDDLARESTVATTVDLDLPNVDRRAAFAAYAVADGTLRAAARDGASSAAIAASVQNGRLMLTVGVSGSKAIAHADLVDVADRVGALGGHMTVATVESGVLVKAEVPCGSSSPTT
jgi:signal transduction histidine kinase